MKMIKFYLTWLVYLWAVQDDKFLYTMARNKGMRAVKVSHEFKLTGSDFVITYDPRHPPQPRPWLTWAEYKAAWHPVTGTRANKEKEESAK